LYFDANRRWSFVALLGGDALSIGLFLSLFVFRHRGEPENRRVAQPLLSVAVSPASASCAQPSWVNPSPKHISSAMYARSSREVRPSRRARDRLASTNRRTPAMPI
jgi:hypothetical protein